MAENAEPWSDLENLSLDEDEDYVQDEENKEAEVISANQVYKMMQNEVKKVCDITDKPSNEVRRLFSLHQIKWDTEKLLEILYEDGEKAKAITASLKHERCLEVSDIWPVCSHKLEDPSIYCKFRCKHSVCRDCLSDYVKLMKETGQLINSIQCPTLGCEWQLDDELVLDGLRTDQLKSCYLKIVCSNFVQSRKLLSWCLGESCTNAIRIPARTKLQARHEPVRCSLDCWWNSLLNDWPKEENRTGEEQDWILESRHECPSCLLYVFLDKSSRGNKMICSVCFFKFCWNCLRDWSSEDHDCMDTSTQINFDSFFRAQRFKTYQKNYEEKKLSYETSVKLLKLSTETSGCVAPAFELLVQCRETMMHCCIFSYFMTTIDNQISIFEENLKILEKYTEELSEELKDNVLTGNSDFVKQKLCKNQRQRLLEHVKEGYEKNWWRKLPIKIDDILDVQRDGQSIENDDC